MQHEVEAQLHQYAGRKARLLRGHVVCAEHLAARPGRDRCARGEDQVVDREVFIYHPVRRVKVATRGEHADDAGATESIERETISLAQQGVLVEESPIEIRDDHPHDPTLHARPG